MSKLRHEVEFDSRIINTIYGMSDYKEDGYQAFMGQPVDYKLVMNALCKLGAT